MHHYFQKLIGLRENIGTSKEEVERLQKEDRASTKGREMFKANKGTAGRNINFVRKLEETKAGM